ncbi:MAG: nuclear transport factor 2 family protein [Chloroflexi bacterium]|nr:nuclear transport factor 2 family protein [Chloroflexota bacterium]
MSEERIDALVQEIADREAIRELVSRYAHCVWTKEMDAIVALFTADGEMDLGDGRPLRGREALRKAYNRMLGPDEFQPFVHDHIIELKGERATGVCHLDLRATIGGRSMIGSGRYEDVYEKADGRWRFRSRKLSMRYLVPLSEGWAERPAGS